MATSLKTIKQQVFATPIDMRLILADNLDRLTHADTINIDDYRAEMYLLRARGVIEAALSGITSSATDFETTPYAGPPIVPKADYDETTTSENTGSGVLYGIVPASTAYTELWTITFTGATAYSVAGSYSGSQGTGSTSTTFTSTNADISIPNDVWAGAPATGDKFYVPVYRHHASIALISTLLACGLYLMGLHGGISTGDAKTDTLYNKGMDLLNKIVQNGAIMGSDFSFNTSDMMVPYEISIFGEDVTNYRADEIARYTDNARNAWYALGW